VAFICALCSTVYVSVLFTVSLNGSARYLANAVDPFCIYPVVVFMKCFLGSTKEEDM